MIAVKIVFVRFGGRGGIEQIYGLRGAWNRQMDTDEGN